MTAKGLVIALDGPDGVGKSTQVQLLEEALKSQGLTVHTTRHSGGTPIGEALRAVSLSNHERPPETDVYISLAMAAALAEDLNKRRAEGETVIIDRSPLAMVAYNGYGANLKNIAWAHELCRQLFKNLGIDILFYLNAPQDVLNQRRIDRGIYDYFENKDSDFHKRVREGYQKGLDDLKSNYKGQLKIVDIDAGAEIDQINQQILNALDT